ncbi:hypothetical protein OUZ56_009894 [Daphnia magna]|uniref:Uncharacterized protein n=1 Tax=Daphnia magna TaxID=35525 RepID=A0ABR0AH81_9CRUS|nr:hypothetical protein OUZ56_009894 [Daphnia magna]
MAQKFSVLIVKELQASLNSEGKAKNDVYRRRNIRATHQASKSLKAGKCYSRVDGAKKRPKIQKKSNGAAVIAPNKAPRNNGEPMTTDTGVPLMLKYAYQETQTV